MGNALVNVALAGVLVVTATFAVSRVLPASDASALCLPFGFDTYEARTSGSDVLTYGTAIELTAAGQAVNQVYTANGESYDLRYQGLESGPRGSRTAVSTSRTIPPSIFKAIMYIEAGWEHGSARAPVTPWGGVGHIKINDSEPGAACGYGLAQITTGMVNNGNASAKQAAIGSHYVFNLAEGARILADKWNTAPEFRPIAGDGNAAYLEDWYYAIWSYNGFAAQNHPLSNADEKVTWEDHPLNPFRDPLRGEVYHCGDGAAPNYGSLSPADFTYPERVYGCMRYPPNYTPAGGSSTDMWPAQTFNMPDLSIPEISEAFDPEHFIDCYYAGFSGGCAAMDFPTTIPEHEVTPNTDSHPVTQAANLFGSPQISVGGPSSVSLTVSGGTPQVSAPVTVQNTGTWVAPYRVRYSDPWLTVRRSNDPAGRRMHAGVAIGAETPVTIASGSAATQPGYTPQLLISVIPSQLPAGTTTGTVWIEPLLGGPAKAISVSVTQAPGGLVPSGVIPGLARD